MIVLDAIQPALSIALLITKKKIIIILAIGVKKRVQRVYKQKYESYILLKDELFSMHYSEKPITI